MHQSADNECPTRGLPHERRPSGHFVPTITTVTGPGNNAVYTMTHFVGIRLVFVNLMGNNKKVLIQPATVSGDTILAGTGSSQSTYIYSRPRLIHYSAGLFTERFAARWSVAPGPLCFRVRLFRVACLTGNRCRVCVVIAIHPLQSARAIFVSKVLTITKIGLTPTNGNVGFTCHIHSRVVITRFEN